MADSAGQEFERPSKALREEIKLSLTQTCPGEAVKISGYFTSKHGLAPDPGYIASARLKTLEEHGGDSGLVALIKKNGTELINFDEKTLLTEFVNSGDTKPQTHYIPFTVSISKHAETKLIPGSFEGAISVDLIYE